MIWSMDNVILSSALCDMKYVKSRIATTLYSMQDLKCRIATMLYGIEYDVIIMMLCGW